MIPLRSLRARLIASVCTGVALLASLCIPALSAHAEDSLPPEVNTVDSAAEGVVINLFDYTVYSQPILTPGYTRSSMYQREGINRNFSQFGFIRRNDFFNNTKGTYVPLIYKDDPVGLAAWYEAHPEAKANWAVDLQTSYLLYSPNVRPGIVKNELGEDGFPHLADAYGGESLAPLFDTAKTDYPGRVATYTGVSYLFQKDARGYQFDSNKNYAWFNPETNNFSVYNTTYQGVRDVSSRAWSQPVGFFPFNQYDPAHPSIERFLGEGLNHHFGMSFATTIKFPEDKNNDPANYKPTYLGSPMTFVFSGDDDAWVFVDGHLTLDIGGIHGVQSGTIDFTNNQVIRANGSTVSITDLMKSQGAEYDNSAGSVHTIQLFYLERGDIASNFSLKNINVPTVKDINVSKVWDDKNHEGMNHPAVTVYLLADGARVKDAQGQDISVELSADNNWQASFKNQLSNRLDDNNQAENIVYSVEEDSPDDYTYIVSDAGTTTHATHVSQNFVITNTIKTYKVNYQYVSGTPDKDLPQEIVASTPAGLEDQISGSKQTSVTPSFTTLETDEGTWSFDSWDADEKIIKSSDISFTGTWVFTPKPEPEDSETPETPKPHEPTETDEVTEEVVEETELPETSDITGLVSATTVLLASISVLAGKRIRH